MMYRTDKHRRIVESLRVMLAIIAGLLMLDERQEGRQELSIAVIAFSIYAITLLWQAANGSLNAQRRVYYWLDSCWFLLLLYLADNSGTHYFLFLLFPVFFAAWRADYRESVAIAAFSGAGALAVFIVNDPLLPWSQLLALPLSLFVIAQVLVALARIEEATQKRQELARHFEVMADSRPSFDAIVSDLILQIAQKMDASVVLLAIKTFSGRCRVMCWEAEHEIFELSEGAAAPVVKQALSLPAEVAVGWLGDLPRWRGSRQIEIGPSGLPSDIFQISRDTLLELSSLAGRERLMSVPISAGSVGKMRLLLAGESIKVNLQTLGTFQRIVEQVGPTVDNACLREELANQAADAERARIGRDLHDTAIQPYIGLKFAIEAVQRRAGQDNPIASDLARLTELVTEELASMREVVSGLRGEPGKGGALLSSAVRRQAARCGQLFGIDVEVNIEADVPVSRRMAGEIFHMVAEGLSNIGRHTKSHWAWVSLAMQGETLLLILRNGNDGSGAPDFTPRSLTERANELGGSVHIQRDALETTVTVSVPITDSKGHDRKHSSDEHKT